MTGGLLVRWFEPLMFLGAAVAVHAAVLAQWNVNGGDGGAGRTGAGSVLVHGASPQMQAAIRRWTEPPVPTSSDKSPEISGQTLEPAPEPRPEPDHDPIAEPDLEAVEQTNAAIGEEAGRLPPNKTAPMPRPRSAEPPRRVERQTARHHSAVRRPQPKTPNAKASPSPASEKVAQAAEANSLGAAAKPATAAGGEAALLPAEERSLLFAWGAAIRAAIERERRYPRSARRAGLEGTTVIALTVTQNGRLIAVRTLVGSGSRTLDAAAKAAAESVSRYPAADPRLGKERYTFELPLAFQLSR